ncbi:coiled-coil-helix-coiled-coil-helix domain-containing protein 5 isoform X4 [Ochotona curzoniae]|uniref:coiled-coil-helix-coiled-coil-helix domain-containing protein 5 isoform X4 n=1 Tax=Ochotona curzoniae TaxID=130825 RepID=UPI001B347783|nr:coiled-coil-helix-coiled-coil-helix domain-containing protein 5 isoform X4 [Ochotona curzoniae]
MNPSPNSDLTENSSPGPQPEMILSPPCSHRQAALEITARYCSRELEQYGQCVAAKPESWQRDCHHLKMSIARCTSTHPIIRQIRQACAEPFEAFEECLRQNEATVGNCAEHVRRFLQCAEQVRLPPSPTTVEQAQPLPAS